MKSRKLMLAVLAVVVTLAAAGCGGNKTAIAVTVIDPASPSSTTGVTVLENSTTVFASSVTGTSTSTVNWYICLPSTVSTTEPTNCTPNLSGYGTITQTGLYTAPSTSPNPNSFVIMATSTVDPSAFGILGVQVGSGISVTFSTPTAVSIAASEHYNLVATVRGTTNTALLWSVNGTAGGDATDGTIVPGSSSPGSQEQTAIYTAPTIVPAASETITATSAADSSVSATTTIQISALTDPTVTAISPPIASAGSVQQDVYVTGANFLNTSTVVVPISGIATPVPTNFVNGTTLQATLPAAALAVPTTLAIQVQTQGGNLSPTTTAANLTVAPARPALLGIAPQSVSQTATNVSVNLMGGFFSGNTTASFNGSTAGVTSAMSSTRQMSVGIPAGGLSTPGLYPIVVQNAAAATAGIPSMAGLNLTVTPNPGSIPGTVTSVAVGANPSAVAIDRADGWALVTNKNTGTNGDGSVSEIDLNTNAVVNTYAGIGNAPTGIAVDDLLPHPLAVVVNSADQNIVGIDLTTGAETTISVAIGTANGQPILPYSIGVNPLTHRAIVTYQLSNQATILDLSTGVPQVSGVAGAVGGTLTSYSTGLTPSVAIDPELNWAVVTQGGAGAINVVDLGRTAVAGGLPGRTPGIVADLFASGSLTVQGVGIDSVNHQVLFTDSNPGGTNQDTDLTAFSLLDQTFSKITFTNGGQLITEPGYLAAAVNPLTGVGIAVNNLDNAATVLNTQTGNVLLASIPVGSAPVAVAADPATNKAVVVNQGDGTASIVSLGAINPVQVIASSPEMTLTSGSSLAVTILGAGFTGTSQVLLDSTPVTVNSVSANGREILATVPAGGAANLLGSPRRFLVQVQNTGGAVSNLADLTVIQAIPVGKSPVGVAVDPDRDFAVVTNSGDNTVSLLALPSPQTGAASVLATQPVGANPQGVAIFPQGGLAIVANHDGNSVSVVDENYSSSAPLNGPYPVPLCPPAVGSSLGCSGPTGVAVDPLTGSAVVTNSTSNNVSVVTLPADSSTPATLGSTTAVDQFPNAVAIDPNPNLNLAAITAASPTSSAGSPSSPVDFLSLGTLTAPPRDLGFELPTGIVFDPVNQMFVVANSLQNEIVLVDPATGIDTPVSVGINPTSVDYNYQTSTLVTANAASNTISVIEYMCAPNGSGAFVACPAPHVQAILPLASSPQFSVAIDPRLNLAVVVDQQDNQALLVPLPY